MLPITLEEMKSVKLMNRTDTKFVTNKQLLEQLLLSVDDEYFVQVTDGNNFADYHTLYYDTDDCQMYVAHHNGKKTRQKLRIRSYLASDVHFLEVKTKDNHGKTKKKRVELDFSEPSVSRLGNALVDDDIINKNADFVDSKLWLSSADMLPKIENRFSRTTLVNKRMTERLTIDTDLRFHNLVTGNDIDLGNIVIIELKHDSLQPSPIIPWLNKLRIFSMGFSKYCIGMALTDPSLKRNRFKDRLHHIEKI